MPNKSELTVYVHIPKTAGTTLISLLKHHYSREQTYKIMMRGMSLIAPKYRFLPKPLISFSKLRRLKFAIGHQQKLRMIHGHFDMSLGKLMPAAASFITILRDPIDRAVSHHNHYRRLTSDPIHPLAMQSSLEEWVSSCRLVEMDNGQTRRLAGEMDLPIGKVSSRTLDTAKANLIRFAVVGLTERFEETQILLHQKFNWPYCRYPSRNVNPTRPKKVELDQTVLSRIKTANQFDIELYQFATELFNRSATSIDMDRELALFRNAPEHDGLTAA